MIDQRGFSRVLVIGIAVAVTVFAIGGYFYFSDQTGEYPGEYRKETTSEAEEESQRSNRDIQTAGEIARDSNSTPQSGSENVPPAILEKPETTAIVKQPASAPAAKAVASSDVVKGYPTNCFPRLGFDNYRTEQTFVINPKNNKEMYINIEYKGMYKSIDGGNTWNFSGKGLKGLPRNDDPSKPCHDLRFHLYIDPSNPKRLLAPGGSAPGSVGEGLGGLAESLDAGATWHQLFTSTMSAYTESAVMDPSNTKIVYVTTSALPQGMDGPDKGKTFVTKGVVYKTVDGGATWEELPTGFFKDLRVPGIFIDARNPNTLRLATFGLPSGTNTDKSATGEQWGFLETRDGGLTWTKLDATRGIGIRNLDVSPTHLDHFYLMASKNNEDKIYYSTNGNLNEPDNRAVNFARYDPHDPTGMRLVGFNVYAQPNGIFESLDGGKTWNVLGKLPSGITNDHRASNIVFDPILKNVIYINADLARVWKSTDNGATWNALVSLDAITN